MVTGNFHKIKQNAWPRRTLHTFFGKWENVQEETRLTCKNWCIRPPQTRPIDREPSENGLSCIDVKVSGSELSWKHVRTTNGGTCQIFRGWETLCKTSNEISITFVSSLTGRKPQTIRFVTALNGEVRRVGLISRRCLFIPVFFRYHFPNHPKNEGLHNWHLNQ